MILYLITHRDSGKMYVGVTSRTLAKRWNQHLYDAGHRGCGHFHSALKKYGAKAFHREVLISTDDAHSLFNLERLFIVLFQTTDLRFGYNLSAGGEGNPGLSISAERKLAVSNAQRGKPKSAEHRAKLSAALKGRGAFYDKTGQKHTPQHIANRVAARKRNRQTNSSSRTTARLFPETA